MANLQNNTNKLNELLEMARNLPEAGSDLSDANALANDLAEGKIAYSKYGKLIGTLKIKLKEVDMLPSLLEADATLIYEYAGYRYIADRTSGLGTWVFNSTITKPSVGGFNGGGFTCEWDFSGGFGTYYSYIGFDDIEMTYGRSGPTSPAYTFTSNTWRDESARTVTFQKLPDSNDFLPWMSDNAIYYGRWLVLYEDDQTASAQASTILEGYSAYVNGTKIEGTMPRRGDAGSITYQPNAFPLTLEEGYYNEWVIDVMPATLKEPVISVNSSGLITAQSKVSWGLLTQADEKTKTKQLNVKAATTYVPTTTDQTIEKDQYLTGKQTIKGDTNLTAANIKSGTKIFNVTGTYTSDATATAADIKSGLIAYSKGQKIIGTATFGTDLPAAEDYTF